MASVNTVMQKPLNCEFQCLLHFSVETELCSKHCSELCMSAGGKSVEKTSHNCDSPGHTVQQTLNSAVSAEQ